MFQFLPILGILVFFFGISQARLWDVNIENFAFSPDTVRISIGDTVRWTNKDFAGHTSTSDSGVWDSGLLSQNQSFQFQFTRSGGFPYHCTPHSWMTGIVIVQHLRNEDCNTCFWKKICRNSYY